MVKSYTYDAFGVEESIDSSDTNPFRYCGEYYDSEIEQIYLRARYYDPSLGRFTQQDPAMADGMNWYTYCGNNPVLYVDPFGLQNRPVEEDYPDETKFYQACLEFEEQTTSDPITVIENGDYITIYAYFSIEGDAQKEVIPGSVIPGIYSGTTYYQGIVDGIKTTWSGNLDGKNVRVITIDVNNSSYLKKDQKALSIKLINDYGISNVSNWVSKTNPGMMTLYTGDHYTDPNGPDGNRDGAAFWWSEKDFKRMVGHEFGHSLGVGDGYYYGYNGNTSLGDIVSLMSSQWDTKATRLDLELALKAQRSNAFQTWQNNLELINTYGVVRGNL